MDKKIEVNVYGIGEEFLGSCCKNNNSCSSECSGGGCNDSCQSSKKCFQAFEDLNYYLKNSDIYENISLNFIEVDSNALIQSEEIRELIKRGFSLPIIIIDDIVRYYGGISKELVYKDVVELIEYYG